LVAVVVVADSVEEVQLEIIDGYSENVVEVVAVDCRDRKLDLVAYYPSLEERHRVEEQELETWVGSNLMKKGMEHNEQRGYWLSRRGEVRRFRKKVQRCRKRSGRVEKRHRRRLPRIEVERVGEAKCSRIRKRVVSLERGNSNCSIHSPPETKRLSQSKIEIETEKGTVSTHLFL